MDAMGNTPDAVAKILTEINAPAPVVSDKVVLDADYSLTKDGKVVHPEDAEAYTVLGGKGSLIPRATAAALGLKGLKEHVPYHPNAEEFARAAGQESPEEEVKRLRREASQRDAELAELRAFREETLSAMKVAPTEPPKTTEPEKKSSETKPTEAETKTEGKK